VPIIFQKGTSSQRSQTLVIGTGINLDQTTDGLAQISVGSSTSGEVVVQPSGGDDTAAIQAAIWPNARVTLAPGTFNISGIIDLAAGISVRGSGMDKTTVVKADFVGPAFRLGDQVQYASIENLRIVGPGKTTTNANKGIQAARSAPPTGLAIARRFSFRNLYIKDLSDYAMHLNNCSQVEIDNVIFENIKGNPIRFEAAGQVVGSARIATVRALNCDAPIYMNGSAGAGGLVSGVSLIACEAESCIGSFRFNTASDCALIGCASRKPITDPALKMTASSNIAVEAFVSDNTGAPADVLHLLIDGGGTGIQISGFRRVNVGAPASEANVTAAGGVVLVGAHNFTAGKIASSNKFADISSTLRP
jgi:hypothetical protein